MFHRRLLLLLGVMCCAVAGLGVQLYHVTVIDGPKHRQDAEDALETRRLLPTVRGRIFDGKGRLLAEDHPCYDIAVDYDVITGEWAYNQARRLAYKDYRARWPRMDFDDREALIAQYRAPFDAQVEELWSYVCRLGAIDRQELARRLDTIKKRVQTIRADVWDRLAKRRAAETSGPVELSDVAVTLAEEEEPHTILPAVSDDVANTFRKLALKLRGLHVIRSSTRVYTDRDFDVLVDRSTFPLPMRTDAPCDIHLTGVAASIVGDMDDVQAEDVARRPFHRPDAPPDLGGYLPGDTVGNRGVEKAEEDRLRGVRGESATLLDSNKVRRRPAQPGKDVHLTIDVALQARIAALMDPDVGLMKVEDWHHNSDMAVGTPLYGSAVVLDVDTGDILAMVSTPSPNDPRNPTDGPDHEPTYNKALAAVYPPGSTVKPLVYCTAVADGAIGLNQTITCNGFLFPDKPGVFRCWGWRPAEGLRHTHGPVDGAHAIEESCDIFFYTCGMKLGAQRLCAGYRLWGFGRVAGLGLPEEIHGLVPDSNGYYHGRQLKTPDAINLGIGQGPLAVPPIQVAAAHAALARGGYYLSPILIRERADRQTAYSLNLPGPAVHNALKGMDLAANADLGSANHIIFNGVREPILHAPGLIVRAKTGTAQTTPRWVDENHNHKLDPGEHVIRAGTHSWYVCHVQKPGADRASYVIVVMVEYGGSGGRTSGPIANQIIHALRDEGYL